MTTVGFSRFLLSLQFLTRSCNKMKTEDRPIPVNRIKAVLAENKFQLNSLVSLLVKMQPQYRDGVIIKLSRQLHSFKNSLTSLMWM